MLFSQALETLQDFKPDDFSKLSDLLEPELIEQCLQATGVTTVRKRRLPMDLMVWTVVGMALFRDMSMRQIVSHLDLMLPGQRLSMAVKIDPLLANKIDPPAIRFCSLFPSVGNFLLRA